MFALLGCASGWSDEIRFGFKSVPPYVMLDANRRISGLEFEIIVAALAASGHAVKAEIMPLERLVRTFKGGSLQAAAPMLPSTNSGGLLSDEYITYTNVVMGLESDSLKIRSTADLKGLRIAAFQTATKVLGADFAAAVRGNRQYKEEAQQIIQIRLLFRKRVDVVVGDTRILHHFINAPENDGGQADRGRGILDISTNEIPGGVPRCQIGPRFQCRAGEDQEEWHIRRSHEKIPIAGRQSSLPRNGC